MKFINKSLQDIFNAISSPTKDKSADIPSVDVARDFVAKLRLNKYKRQQLDRREDNEEDSIEERSKET